MAVLSPQAAEHNGSLTMSGHHSFQFDVWSSVLRRNRTCLLGLTILTMFGVGCWGGSAPPSPTSENTALSVAAVATLEADIRTFCGACHVMPQPESFPKAMWYEEVKRGYDFYYLSQRHDLKPPRQTDVAAYFRERAPEQIARASDLTANLSPSPITFDEVTLTAAIAVDLPAISFVDLVRSTSDSIELRFSDMRHGIVSVATMPRSLAPGMGFAAQFKPTSRLLSQPCQHPAAVRDCDLDGNGRADLVVCDLGSFLPEDHALGQLVWIPDAAHAANAQPQVLLSGIGRIADVRVADFDGDEDEDLVVAEFGWHKTGGIHLIWNDGPASPGEQRSFRTEQLDKRAGTIQVPTVDLNGDGRIDFIAVISQEHETVVAFLNRPDGFERVTLFAAPDPSFGSSGIELTDLDQDGDIDVLYTNGDTFDSFLIKPFHGVIWLENKGSFPFVTHQLTLLPGVHRALPGDLDGDGDLDIVAAALVPTKLARDEDRATLDAIVWLEQTEPGQFQRHPIRTGQPIHAAMVLGDIDGDRRLDIAVGSFHETPDPKRTSVTLLFNRGDTKSAARETRNPREEFEPRVNRISTNQNQE